MTDSTARRIFVGSWLFAFIIVGWISWQQAVQRAKGGGVQQVNIIDALPPPPRIVAASLVWSILGVISEGAPKIAALMGMGLLLPLFLITQGETPQQASGTTSGSSQLASAAIGASIA